MKKKIKIAALMVSILTLSIFANAGSASGNITQLLPHTGNLMFIYIDGPIVGAPSCASITSSQKRYVVSAADKIIVATLMLAFNSGKQINVAGSGDCSVWGDTETIRYITLSK